RTSHAPFPYTTHFRSRIVALVEIDAGQIVQGDGRLLAARSVDLLKDGEGPAQIHLGFIVAPDGQHDLAELIQTGRDLHVFLSKRSEEHTSELQSRENI